MEPPASKEIKIIVKWSGKEYPIEDLTDYDTVAVLKHEIFKKTQVKPERQKLLNLKYKGKFATDEVRLGLLELKANFKLMMVGSLEADIEEASSKPDDIGNVVNDLDNDDDEKVPLENKEVYLAKINKRVRDYKINELNPPREGKRLLVLDIDYTLFDHRSAAENGAELMRPYLHEFLTSAYQDYDIAIWSATSMKWIVEKMKLLGVTTHPDYKLVFMLDSEAMITVHCPVRGVIEVKPLGVIWGKYSQYSSKNTIMFDDLRRNFLMNPKSGLRIKPFAEAHLNRHKDKELLKLTKYLKDIADNCNDFNELNHKKWESYKPKKRRETTDD
ncbi:ubiquitin-like domain-containing CTD phosphatase 1 [Aedes aegypti]|uniref:Ubiquitin-like domain-containing CTD phosphatase 1 n=1 Tax=Aedes aegypti TaxID=7159 RepID=A0A1S4F429_AEDAE|nr:ubiquitin-like domain-containing CTD phosphatase 1 [Aedes aegypti]